MDGRNSTASGGANDAQTQVNNPALPNTLLLTATAPEPPGDSFVSVSPDQNFAVSALPVQHYHVDFVTGGPDSALVSDNWAGFTFGSRANSQPVRLFRDRIADSPQWQF